MDTCLALSAIGDGGLLGAPQMHRRAFPDCILGVDAVLVDDRIDLIEKDVSAVFHLPPT